MSKNTIIGLTVVLCVLAAGVGAFFGMRGRAVPATPATEVAAEVPAQPAPVGLAVPPVPAPAETSVREPMASPVAAAEPVAAPASSSTISPASRQGATKSTTSARSAVDASSISPVKPADPDTIALDKPSAASANPPALTDQPVPVAATAGQQATESPVVPTPPAAPPVEYDEVVVGADSVLGVMLDSTVSSETARVEDPVEAHVSRDVRVGSVVAIPSGTRALGIVTQVERGGRMKNRARIGIRFHTLVLADGSRATIQTDAIFREGDSPGQEAAGKMGAAAAGGAILGAILGGGKGAAIGGSIGAAGGAAAVMNSDRNAAALKAGTSLTVRLLRPVTVVVAR
jgi:hypothetical protein